jgi:hypothetical protein
MLLAAKLLPLSGFHVNQDMKLSCETAKNVLFDGLITCHGVRVRYVGEISLTCAG